MGFVQNILARTHSKSIGDCPKKIVKTLIMWEKGIALWFWYMQGKKSGLPTYFIIHGVLCNLFWYTWFQNYSAWNVNEFLMKRTRKKCWDIFISKYSYKISEIYNNIHYDACQYSVELLNDSSMIFELRNRCKSTIKCSGIKMFCALELMPEKIL